MRNYSCIYIYRHIVVLFVYMPFSCPFISCMLDSHWSPLFCSSHFRIQNSHLNASVPTVQPQMFGANPLDQLHPQGICKTTSKPLALTKTDQAKQQLVWESCLGSFTYTSGYDMKIIKFTPSWHQFTPS